MSTNFVWNINAKPFDPSLKSKANSFPLPSSFLSESSNQPKEVWQSPAAIFSDSVSISSTNIEEKKPRLRVFKRFRELFKNEDNKSSSHIPLSINTNPVTMDPTEPFVTSPTTISSSPINQIKTIYLPPTNNKQAFSLNATNKTQAYEPPQKRIQNIKEKIASIQNETSIDSPKKVIKYLDLAKESSLSPVERVLYTEAAAKTVRQSTECVALRTEAYVAHARALVSNNNNKEALQYFSHALKYLGGSNAFLTKEKLQAEIKSLKDSTRSQTV